MAPRVLFSTVLAALVLTFAASISNSTCSDLALALDKRLVTAYAKYHAANKLCVESDMDPNNQSGEVWTCKSGLTDLASACSAAGGASYTMKQQLRMAATMELHVRTEGACLPQAPACSAEDITTLARTRSKSWCSAYGLYFIVECEISYAGPSLSSKQAQAGLYAVTITQNYHPPVTSEIELVGSDGKRSSTGSWNGGAIGQATGAIDGTSGLMYMLTGGLKGPGGKTGDVLYRVVAHRLSDGVEAAYYPLPMVPDTMPPWTGFGQQMGLDVAKKRVLVLGPSKTPPPGANPFPYNLWVVDLKDNTTKVLRDVGLCTPVSEGYPAVVDTARRRFWTIIGDPSFERKLIAFDMDTGATVANVTVMADTAMQLLVYDKRGKLWGVGNPRSPTGFGGPLLLLEIDPVTGNMGKVTKTNLVERWQANAMPAEVAFDTASNEIVFHAFQYPKDAPKAVHTLSLIRLPVDSPTNSREQANFCSTVGSNYTCPKLLSYFDPAPVRMHILV